jgi:hypothetical protein
MPIKASIAWGSQSLIAGTVPAEPPSATAFGEMMASAGARGRPLRCERVRFGGKHLGATATRISAGSFSSLTNARRKSRRGAVGCSNPIVRILLVRTVRRFGVSRCRPPRRSPGLEPLNIVHPPGSHVIQGACTSSWASLRPIEIVTTSFCPARFCPAWHLGPRSSRFRVRHLGPSNGGPNQYG